MAPFVIAKGIASIAVTLGVNRVVCDIVRNNTVVVTTADKVLVGVGSLVLSSMAVEAAGDHFERQIKKVNDWRESKKDPVLTEA